MTVPFELQPTLCGALVTLRPLRAEDWAELYAVASDPLIWEQHPEPDRHLEPVFRRFFQGALDSGGAFAAVDPATGRILGSSRYFGLDPEASEIEIGWTFLARSHWGGQTNGEMKRLMLDHAFRFVDHVIFLIGPQNLRSRRAIERVGGHLVGPRMADGRESVVYRISRPGAGTPTT